MLADLFVVTILWYKQISVHHISEINIMLYQSHINLKKEIENVELNEK